MKHLSYPRTRWRSLAFSLNLSHGGLRRRERGLCANEAELVALCESDPEAAKMFDVKRGWKKAGVPDAAEV